METSRCVWGPHIVAVSLCIGAARRYRLNLIDRVIKVTLFSHVCALTGGNCQCGFFRFLVSFLSSHRVPSSETIFFVEVLLFSFYLLSLENYEVELIDGALCLMLGQVRAESLHQRSIWQSLQFPRGLRFICSQYTKGYTCLRTRKTL